MTIVQFPRHLRVSPCMEMPPDAIIIGCEHDSEFSATTPEWCRCADCNHHFGAIAQMDQYPCDHTFESNGCIESRCGEYNTLHTSDMVDVDIGDRIVSLCSLSADILMADADYRMNLSAITGITRELNRLNSKKRKIKRVKETIQELTYDRWDLESIKNGIVNRLWRDTEMSMSHELMAAGEVNMEG